MKTSRSKTIPGRKLGTRVLRLGVYGPSGVGRVEKEDPVILT